MDAILVVIPARMGSTRFPGKVLAPVGDRSLIRCVCERAAGLPGIAELLVATDDPRVAEDVRAGNWRVVMTRETHLSGTDRVAEAAGDWPGLVLNLQGDEPLFDLGTVTRLLRRFEREEALVMGTAAVPLAAEEWRHPDRVKVLRDRRGFARDFRRLLASAEPESGCELLRHAGVYLFRAHALRRFAGAQPTERERAEGLEQLRALSVGMAVWVEKGRRWGPGVDRPEDLKVVARLVTKG